MHEFLRRSKWSILDRAALFAVALVGLWFTIPFSFWFDVGEVYVFDTEQGAEIKMLHSGQVNREFMGSYSANVRLTSNRRVVVCEGRGGPFTYTTGNNRPDPLTLRWWIGNTPDCTKKVQARPGVYLVETCWVLMFGPLEKRQCVTSNSFEIVPKGESEGALSREQREMRDELKSLKQKVYQKE